MTIQRRTFLAGCASLLGVGAAAADNLKTTIKRELELRKADPLMAAYEGLTDVQKRWVNSSAREKVAEGGNQSGKTWSGCSDFLLDALGLHPARKWKVPYPGAVWKGWYATTTYQLFAEQAWHHWKKLLLFAGENLPMRNGQTTRRILAIGWHARSPERVAFLKLRRADGGVAEVYVKSYDQGRGEFQSAEVDKLLLDEECPEDIYDEAQPRVVKRGGQIAVTETPVVGVTWLENLRARAEAQDTDVYHTRFSTLDNPGLKMEFLAPLLKKYEGRPDLAKLRLQGFPIVDEGKVYPDTLFTVPGRIVQPFRIPHDWTKYRCSDHGVHVVATLWAAVAPGRKKIALYREYYGEDVEPSVRGNALNVLRLSKGDGWGPEIETPGGAQTPLRLGENAYVWRGIDRATLGAGQETGQRLIDLWNEVGVCSRCGSEDGKGARCTCGGERVRINVAPAMDNRLEPGIEAVKLLLGERAPDGSPLFVVFDTCTNFLRERRGYGRKPIVERKDRDEGNARPVKASDHAMDCWRYLALYGMEWKPWPAPALPPQGTVARKILESRMKGGA